MNVGAEAVSQRSVRDSRWERWEGRLRERLEKGDLELPPLPDIAQRAMAMARDESTSAADLAELMNRDAALASALLRRANSVALGAATRVASAHQAVARLGMREASEIAVAVSLRAGLFQGQVYPTLANRIWRQSLASGLFAKEVMRSMGRDIEIAFLCGLLADVGQPMVLNELGATTRAYERPDEETAASLARALGPQFAATAVRSWALPGVVIESIMRRDEEPSEESRVASLGQRLAEIVVDPEAEIADFEADPDAVALCLEPQEIARVIAQADRIREETEGMP
ncbi:MAG: HDOD domain-containing protein [Myxococcota bacterium]